MRQFSRWMPRKPTGRPTSLVAWLLAGLVATTLLAILAFLPVGRIVLVLLIVGALVSGAHSDRYYRRLAAARIGEDIGTFARAIDRRTPFFDPWVVRAVWDGLQPQVAFRGGHVPLRPTDHLYAELRVDSEDLELDILPEIAWRARRSLENIAANPLCGQVATVGDLIELVATQPPRGAA